MLFRSIRRRRLGPGGRVRPLSGKPRDRRGGYGAAEPPLGDRGYRDTSSGHASRCRSRKLGLGVESHQVSSSWKLDTSRSISNRYAPRGGLDEYQIAAADAAHSAAPLSFVVVPPGDFYDFFECSFESPDERVVSIVNLRNFVRQMCSIMCLPNVV